MVTKRRVRVGKKYMTMKVREVLVARTSTTVTMYSMDGVHWDSNAVLAVAIYERMDSIMRGSDGGWKTQFRRYDKSGAAT